MNIALKNQPGKKTGSALRGKLTAAAFAALLCLLLMPGQAMAASNLIKNGNASSGLKYWKQRSGQWVATEECVPSLKGKYFFPGQTEKAELSQDISVSGMPVRQELTLTAKCRDYSGADVCILRMTFFNAQGKKLLTVQNSCRTAAWTTLRLVCRKPVGAAKLRVSLVGERHSGSDNDTYFDNVVLKKTMGSNLISNGSGENGMSCWVDKQNIWSAVTGKDSTEHNPVKGSYFMWPERDDVKSSKVYQDVPVLPSEIGKTATLSAWLANYDQSPHDKSTLKLQFLSGSGKVISSLVKSQRNPNWRKHIIKAKIPKKTATIRVLLIGTRYVGSDLDSYFDDVRLSIG